MGCCERYLDIRRTKWLDAGGNFIMRSCIIGTAYCIF